MLPDDPHENKAENKQLKNRNKRKFELGHNKARFFKGPPNYEIKISMPLSDIWSPNEQKTWPGCAVGDGEDEDGNAHNQERVLKPSTCQRLFLYVFLSFFFSSSTPTTIL